MEKQELLRCLKNRQIIVTNGRLLAESSVTPFNEDCLTEYVIEVSIPREWYLLLSFIHDSEPSSKHHDYDYGQDYSNPAEIAIIIQELCNNSNIFVKKQFNK